MRWAGLKRNAQAAAFEPYLKTHSGRALSAIMQIHLETASRGQSLKYHRMTSFPRSGTPKPPPAQ